MTLEFNDAHLLRKLARQKLHAWGEWCVEKDGDTRYRAHGRMERRLHALMRQLLRLSPGSFRHGMAIEPKKPVDCPLHHKDAHRLVDLINKISRAMLRFHAEPTGARYLRMVAAEQAFEEELARLSPGAFGKE